MIEALFYTVLSTASPVAAIAGTNIFPLVVPTDNALPAIDYRFIGGSSSPTLTTSGTNKYRVEVNCWATTYAAAVSLRAAVITSLNGYVDSNMTIQMIQPQDLFDHDLLQYRAMCELYVYTTL